MENKNKYTKAVLELMIADYVTGKLSVTESDLFEQTVREYPDILSEVNKYKSLFNKIDRVSLIERNEVLSRNISVKLNDKLTARKASISKFSKFFVPATSLVIVVLILIVFSRPDNKIYNNLSKINTYSINKIISDELMGDTIITENYLNDFSYTPAMQEANIEFDNIINDLFDEVVNAHLSESISIGLNDLSYINEDDLMGIFDNFENNEVQLILEELNHVKINH